MLARTGRHTCCHPMGDVIVRNCTANKVSNLDGGLMSERGVTTCFGSSRKPRGMKLNRHDCWRTRHIKWIRYEHIKANRTEFDTEARSSVIDGEIVEDGDASNCMASQNTLHFGICHETVRKDGWQQKTCMYFYRT